MLLHHGDGVDNISKGQVSGIHGYIQLFLLRCHGGSIGNQPLHLGLGAAIAQLKIVQHGVVLLCKALVGILDGRHVGAHLIGVVAHVGHGTVGVCCGLGCIAAQGLEQGRGEAGDRLHVLVGAEARGLVCLVGVLLHLLRALLKERVHAADELLLLCKALDSLFAQVHQFLGSLFDGGGHELHAADDGLRGQV